MKRIQILAAVAIVGATVVLAASPPASAAPARRVETRAAQCGGFGTPGQRWVQHVYLTLLGRCAEPAAADQGDAMLNDPGKRGAYTRSLVRSLESGYLWVGRWTRAYCGRQPRLNEGRSYANKLAITDPRDHPSRWEYVKGLVIGEYCAYKHFGGTDESYVRGLFLDILGREASASDVAYYKGRSGLKMSIDLGESSEGRRVQVRRSFQTVLGRAAKKADLDYWMPRLLPNKGYDKLNLDAALAASNEFVRRANTITA